MIETSKGTPKVFIDKELELSAKSSEEFEKIVKLE